MTPAIDALAKRGVRFATAVAHAPLTGPSHASILTGRTPLGHGFRNNGGFVLAAGSEHGRRGLPAGGIPHGGLRLRVPARPPLRVRSRIRHLRRSPAARERPAAHAVCGAECGCHDGRVLRWLSRPPDPRGQPRPWFLWVHYYDPHAPYEPPAPTSRSASPRRRMTARSHPSIGSSARLLRSAAATRMTGPTLVLVTSDHGESLGEHGEATHGVFVYDATTRVPWIMAGPGVAAGRVSARSRAGSTCCRRCSTMPVFRRHGVEGRSLRPAADGREMADAPAYAESLYPELELGWAPSPCVADGVVQAHRCATAGALRSRTPTRPKQRIGSARASPRSRQLRRDLGVALRQVPPSAAAAPVDASTIERLRALGYVAGGSGVPTGTGALRTRRMACICCVR